MFQSHIDINLIIMHQLISQEILLKTYVHKGLQINIFYMKIVLFSFIR